MAATPRTPTTVPTAMPTVLDELSESFDASDVGVTVITTPALVMTAWEVVEEAEEEELDSVMLSVLATLTFSPVL